MKIFNSILIFLLLVVAFNAKAQEPTLNEKISTIDDKINGLLERVATDEADLSKLTKIKISGYMQTQFQNFENPGLLSTTQNYFSIRRARVKFSYEAAEGVKFVLTPDFSPGAFALKDAYVVVNDRWTKAFSLTAGKFNRLNYEVEYSSSQRELPERSKLIGTLYPSERALGAKLEFNPLKMPVHLQLAVFNGGDGTNTNNAANENKDYDNFKDVMARVTYNLSLGSFGGLDFGAHGYFGNVKSITTKTLSSDYNTIKDIKLGDPLKRNWLGGEFQLFADVLGGLSIKGEYIAGKTATGGATTGTIVTPNFQNNFAGYYLYFIKNLGKKYQFAFRLDYFDPNTDITGKDVKVKGYTTPDATTLSSRMSGKSDLAQTTFGFALHHYFDDNIRITAAYEIVQNEKVGSLGLLTEDYVQADGQKVAKGLDYGKIVNQNVFTLRIQAKF